MNVVLDEAEEVWIKDTKSKKAGDRATLGECRVCTLMKVCCTMFHD